MDPDVELSALTVRAADTEARHKIPAFPLRRGLSAVASPLASGPSLVDAPANPSSHQGTKAPSARTRLRRVPLLGTGLAAVAAGWRQVREWAGEASFWAVRLRRMRRVDLLIVAGSNQLSDYFGGPWNFPYNIWAWTLAARLAGVRVAFLSVGAGPIRTRRAAGFIRASVRRAAYVSYRDLGSREAAVAIGVPGPYTLAPDLAYALEPKAPPREPGAGGPFTVAIVPIPYFDPRFWAEPSPSTYQRYVKTLADFAAALIERGDRVRFAPTQLRADPLVVADILRALQAARPGAAAAGLSPRVETFEDLVAVLGDADLVVATRFHGVLIAQMLARPTIGIVYRPSMRGQLEDVGQGAYALDIADITAERLLDRLDALRRDVGATSRIAERLAANRVALDAQIRRVLGAETMGPSATGAPI